jgi:hypothetical protein
MLPKLYFLELTLFLSTRVICLGAQLMVGRGFKSIKNFVNVGIKGGWVRVNELRMSFSRGLLNVWQTVMDGGGVKKSEKVRTFHFRFYFCIHFEKFLQNQNYQIFTGLNSNSIIEFCRYSQKTEIEFFHIALFKAHYFFN